MLACIIFKPNSAKIFYKSLNKEEKVIFENIFYERSKIYVYGFIFGFFIAYISLRNSYLDDIEYSKVFLAIVLTIQFFIYQIYPKPISFNMYIKENEKLKLYNSMNEDYKKISHIGFLVGGLIGYNINNF